LGFPTGWSFTTHKDCLLHINLAPAANFLGAITSQHSPSFELYVQPYKRQRVKLVEERDLNIIEKVRRNTYLYP
jgi:hypothetical protein